MCGSQVPEGGIGRQGHWEVIVGSGQVTLSALPPSLLCEGTVRRPAHTTWPQNSASGPEEGASVIPWRLLNVCVHVRTRG